MRNVARIKWYTIGLLMVCVLLGACQSSGGAAVASSVAGQKQPNVTPAWDIVGDSFSHDPSLIKAGSTWYEFFTADGIGIKKSSDGRSWVAAGRVFHYPLDWWTKRVPDKTDFNIWAPDISFYNGKYCLFYSVSTFGSNTSAIGLATADNPMGPWSDGGTIISSRDSNNYNCIDPNLFVDPKDGRPYLAFGSFWNGIYLVPLDPQSLKPSGSPTQLASRPGATAIEAPFIIFEGGHYYLFTSWDFCCRGVESTYKITYARAEAVTGPYLDKAGRPALNGGGTILDRSAGRWIGPGGQSVLRDGAQWLLVHHAYDADRNGMASLRIKELYFDAAGWPTYVKEE